jgi:hypothetical protein
LLFPLTVSRRSRRQRLRVLCALAAVAVCDLVTACAAPCGRRFRAIPPEQPEHDYVAVLSDFRIPADGPRWRTAALPSGDGGADPGRRTPGHRPEDAARHFAGISSSRAAYLRVKLAGYDYEVFSLLLLDTRHRLIEFVELFRGTIDGASVLPREVVRETLRVNAAAAIFAHNHPSGNPEPSQADELTTSRLKDALALIDVRTLDHIIIAGDKTTSLAESALL